MANTADIMKGTDIPITLINLPVGIDIKRLDFAQNGEIVITKTHNDFTIDGTTGVCEITQSEALKLDARCPVEIQLAYYIDGKARRTYITTIPVRRILYEGEV